MKTIEEPESQTFHERENHEMFPRIKKGREKRIGQFCHLHVNFGSKQQVPALSVPYILSRRHTFRVGSTHVLGGASLILPRTAPNQSVITYPSSPSHILEPATPGEKSPLDLVRLRGGVGGTL